MWSSRRANTAEAASITPIETRKTGMAAAGVMGDADQPSRHTERPANAGAASRSWIGRRLVGLEGVLSLLGVLETREPG